MILMKKIFIPKSLIHLFFTFFFSTISLAQNERSFKTLDYKSVMSRLFERAKFDSNHEALWRPDFEYAMNMPVSNDGYCHTALDTTMYFAIGKAKYAVMIFATYEYLSEYRVSCHACLPTLGIAIFTKYKGQNWRITRFKKNFTEFGQWGKIDGAISLVKLGKEIYGLNIKSAIGGNQGYVSGYSTFYNLHYISGFQELFSYVYYDSSVSAKGDKEGLTIEKSIKLLPSDNEYYTIEMSTENSCSKEVKKNVYKYTYELGRYDSVP